MSWQVGVCCPQDAPHAATAVSELSPCSHRHSSGQGLAAHPPQRPLVSPGQQGSGMSHVRLLQRLAGDTLNVL